MIWNSESLFKGESENLDTCITDLTIINGSYFKDSCARFVTSGNDEKGDNIRVYRYEEGKITMIKTVEHKYFAYSTLFVPSMKSLVSFDHDGHLKFFDIENDFEPLTVVQLDVKAPIWRGICVSKFHICVIQNPNDRGGFLTICDWRDGEQTFLESSHKDEVWSVRQLISNESILVSGGGDNCGSDTSIRVWDWKKEKLVKVFKRVHNDRIVYLKSFVESKTYEERVVSSSRDGVLVVWSLEGEAIRVLSSEENNEGKAEGFYCFMFVRESFCLIGGEMGSLFTCDLKNRVLKKIKDKEHEAKIDQIYWANHRKKSIISVGREGDIRMIMLLENQKFNDDEDERIEFLIDSILNKRIQLYGKYGYYKVSIKVLPYYLLV